MEDSASVKAPKKGRKRFLRDPASKIPKRTLSRYRCSTPNSSDGSEESEESSFEECFFDEMDHDDTGMQFGAGIAWSCCKYTFYRY